MNERDKCSVMRLDRKSLIYSALKGAIIGAGIGILWLVGVMILIIFVLPPDTTIAKNIKSIHMPLFEFVRPMVGKHNVAGNFALLCILFCFIGFLCGLIISLLFCLAKSAHQRQKSK